MTSLLLAWIAVNSFAGDSNGQGKDQLTISNSSTQLLGQIGGVSSGGAAAVPTQHAEEGWLSGLHVSGFLSQTFGMWQNPSALRDFTPSRNNLAVSRTLLQVDENYRLDENNTFFMREWFVYEPPYSFDSANNKAYAAGVWRPAMPPVSGIS